jgi:predicted Zn-dependent protease
MNQILGRIAEIAGFGVKAYQIAAWLQRYGYIDAAIATMHDAFRDHDFTAIFHKAADLVDEMFTESIADIVDRPRCGCSDIAMLKQRGAPARVAQWPKGHVVNVYLADLPRGTLTASDWADVFREALKSWSDVSGFKWELVTSKPPHGLTVFSENEDGPNKTLAWCELPVGGVRLYRMKLDESERWVKAGGSGVIAQAVVAHELGHGIGIEHIAETSGKALMNPFYSPSVVKPLSRDVTEAVRRYGPAASGPVDPPPPAPTEEGTLLLDGVKYRVVRAA